MSTGWEDEGMTETPRHTTHIDHLPHLAKWVPYCDLCGTIGASQDYMQDAVAIAERHESVGGFER